MSVQEFIKLGRGRVSKSASFHISVRLLYIRMLSYRTLIYVSSGVIQSHPGLGHPGSQGRWLIIRIRVIWLDLPLLVLNGAHSVIWTLCLTPKTTFWLLTNFHLSIWGKSLAWLPSMLINDSSLNDSAWITGMVPDGDYRDGIPSGGGKLSPMLYSTIGGVHEMRSCYSRIVVK